MKTQLFGRGTRRVVIEPKTLATVGGYAVASFENGHWVPCQEHYIGHHLPTLAKALSMVFEGFTAGDLLEVGEAFATAALWADCEDGTRPRATRQLKGVGMALAVALAQAKPACVAVAVEKMGLHQFGHDLYMTACGHGVGFWDRDELPIGVGDALTAVMLDWHLEPEQWRGYMTAAVNFKK